MKLVLILLAAILVQGCATTPKPYSEASQIPTENLFVGYQKFSQAKDGLVRIVVVRDSGILGAAAGAQLSIDGEPIGKFWPGDRLELFLRPESYVFALEPTPLFFGAIVETEVVVKQGREAAYRIALDMGGAFSLQRSTYLR